MAIGRCEFLELFYRGRSVLSFEFPASVEVSRFKRGDNFAILDEMFRDEFLCGYLRLQFSQFYCPTITLIRRFRLGTEQT